MEKISIIIPVYGEKELVPVLYNRLISVVKNMNLLYEIIYINDACPYGSGTELKKIAEIDKNVTVINFSRNFGELSAVKAGIDYCKGDWAVVMDCDLQDKPEDILLLYSKAKEGYDIVWGERKIRKDNYFKKFLSHMFYYVNNLLSEIKVTRKIGSFSIISRKVINELKKIDDYTFNYMYCVKFCGFKETYIPIIKESRKIGKSQYNIIKGISYAVKVMVFSSNRLLLIPVFSSFLLIFIALLLLLFGILGIFSAENTSYLLILLVFICSVLCINISILGLYIGMIFKEISTKPHYIIEDIYKGDKIQ